MSSRTYRFGEFTLDAARACLRRGETEVALRPKSFALLEYLTTHAGRVVGKDELLSAVWPGLVVTEDSLTRCVSEVRAALGDSAQTVIKTVTKRGYLFDAPVTTLGSTDSAPVPTQANSGRVTAVRTTRVPGWLVWAGLAVLLAGIALLGFRRLREPAAEAPRLSLVVLPFAELSVDPGVVPARDYLATIVTDDLTIALSRLQGALVIAPGSARAFKDKSGDLRQVGRELGVRYALQGSVLRSDGRLRISATLADVQSLVVLWTDQFDVDPADLPNAQDGIVARLANALGAGLVQAESQRPHLTGAQLDAEDLAMRCEATWLRLGADGDPQTRESCEQALRLDPGNVRALVQLATWHAIRVSRMQSSDSRADVAQAREFVERALAAAPDDYAVHCAKARVLEIEHRLRDAVVEAQRCAQLNPSHAAAYLLLAIDHFFLAEPQQTLEYVRRGMRISPRDPLMPVLLTFKGWAYFQLHQDAEAVRWLTEAVANAPENPTPLAALASVLALNGRDAEAQAAMARYLASKNAHTKTVSQWNRGAEDNPSFRAFGERFRDGLRKAGMPER